MTFSLEDIVSVSVNAQWGTTLFEDTDCDRVVDNNELPITGSVLVSTSNNKVYLLSHVLGLSNAVRNSNYQYTVRVRMIFTNSNGVNYGITRNVEDQNNVHVTSDSMGVLELTKTVGTSLKVPRLELVTVRVRGDILEYVIHFTYVGSQPITEVDIYDAPPTFSHLETAIFCPTTLSTGLTCATVPSGRLNVNAY